MSVPKGKRNLSDMQFYINALKLRKVITFVLLKDFGIRPKVRNIDFLEENYKMTLGDKETLLNICNKYHMSDKVLATYPQWIIEKLRLEVYDLLSQLTTKINLANSIYPACLNDCELRRSYQNECIGLCYALKDKLTFITEILPADYNRYMRYIKAIDDEIILLKGWRKKTNQMKKRFIKD